ncbi:hypothetical protein E2562_016368 [Oryza meyeriana var. granulata]|uniref:Uncharacterized protein n=1 Tax=Oryza meyeriana var. granulata TaxID=110450 RepID=A0A6G1DXY1_9ORYZ|nr:hypothetical protein E2562_016368 [Oryza meyeriana var. granulata]
MPAISSSHPYRSSHPYQHIEQVGTVASPGGGGNLPAGNSGSGRSVARHGGNPPSPGGSVQDGPGRIPAAASEEGRAPSASPPISESEEAHEVDVDTCR